MVKDARRIDGPLTLWQKDDKVWLELMPDQFGKPFLLSPKIRSGIGEGLVLGGLMAFPISGVGGTQVIEFVRVHNTVRLQARNTDAVARPGSPEARAVASGYSVSLLGSGPVASLPHPERRSVLVDASSLFLNDLMGVGMQLQRMFRQGYGLERTNTTFTALRGSGEATVIETTAHFYTGSVATFAPSFFPGVPQPQVPRYLPDARSLLVGLHYSISRLPDEPMAPRRADARLGHFTSTVMDFSNDLSHSPRQRIVHRWRLEKKDPAAEMSEPVRPITFWIDRNVPLAYRDTVREGILEWNKAFERIGYRNAIVVQQQPDNATFDTLDTGYASVRWMTNADAMFAAIGPSHVDPRSGEILDADVAIESMASRAMRAARVQVLGSRAVVGSSGDEATPPVPAAFARAFGWPRSPRPADPQDAALARELSAFAGDDAHRYCLHGALSADQLGYFMDVLDARGEVQPDDERTQRFVLAHIKDTVMHEIGHALGLRHNFRASRAYSQAQLSDPAFTAQNGNSGSVMEYSPVNLGLPGQPAGAPFQTTLGPYDYWAVEYAYRPMPPGTSPEQEELELLRIAARNTEPLLAYGSDEDHFLGLDPETALWDLGDDPIAFAARRLEIARDLFQRQETRVLPGDRDYAVLRRSLSYAINDSYNALGLLARQIGGIRTLRDFPGSGRDPLVPASAQVQRKALDLIARSTLSAQALSISPALQRRLAPDYLDRQDFVGLPTDFAAPQRLLDMQRAVLAFLLSDWVATRVLDGADKLDKPADAFRLSEIHRRVSQDVWSELRTDRAPTAARRELQRDHAQRLAATLMRPSFTQRADARSLMREESRQLVERLQSRLARPAGLDAETRAHYRDSAEVLQQALRAQVIRLQP